MTVIDVISAGPFNSIQDSGRRGYMRFGVPASGPMDRIAFQCLRAALQGGDDFAAIEVSLGGLQLSVKGGPITAGFIGGEFLIDLNGERIAPWSVFTIPADSTLTMRPGPSGSWGYIGFCAEIGSVQWLESRSMHLTSGLCGRSLEAGDSLSLLQPKLRNDLNAALPIPEFARFNGAAHVVMGPQAYCFSKDACEKLISEPFAITQEYDRMGMRLSGPSIAPKSSLSIPSEALLRGTVQVPGHGDPLLLLADHQTTGGYPKIATMITADQDRLTQARAMDEIRFQAVSSQEANHKTRDHMAKVQNYIDAISEHRGTFSERLSRMNIISGVVGPG